MNSPDEINEYEPTEEDVSDHKRHIKKHLDLLATLPPPEPPSPLQSQVGGVHYKDFAIQPVEFCQRNGLNYCEANAIKYVCRHRLKGSGRQDIEKAIHYLQLLLEIEYPESK